MITATRKSAVELEDGTLEVVVHVHAGSKGEFFGVAPKPGDWISITAKEKPPTQGAAPAGADAPPPPMASAEATTISRGLIKSPIFQAYVDECEPLLSVAEKDAERAAARYLHTKTAGIGGMTSLSSLAKVRADFSAWCKSKGYADA